MTVTQTFNPDKNPQLLYQTETKQGELKVVTNEHHMWISIDDVLQTAINLEPPYISAFPHVVLILLPLLHEAAPRTILELGAGGLAIQRFMANAHPDIRMISVEMDEDIIDAVKNYFPASDKLNVIRADAFDFIKFSKTKQSQYDWLIVDLYQGDNSPIYDLSSSHIDDLHSLITTDGWLMLNCLTNKPEVLERITSRIESVFGHKPHLFAVPEMMNHIYMIKKSKLFEFPADLEQHNMNHPDFQLPE